MQWNNSYQESLLSFANNINTHEGGTHLSGFRSALTRTRQRLRAQEGPAEGEGGQPPGRGRARGPDRDHLGEDPGPAVRGPDEDQARQPAGRGLRPGGREPRARRVPRGEPRRGARRSSARRCRRSRAREAARKARDLTRRKSALENSDAARQARRLLGARPVARRALHRRGRLGRRLRQAGPRPQHAGRSCRCAARSSTSRRTASTRCSRNKEIQALITAIGTGIREEFDIEKARYHKVIVMMRRRRRRRAHPHARPHLPLPRDAGADRGRLRLHREAAALQGEGRQQGASTSRRSPSSRRSCCATSSRRWRSSTARASEFKLTHARWQKFVRLLKQYEGWASSLRAEYGHDADHVPRGSRTCSTQGSTDADARRAAARRAAPEGEPYETEVRRARTRRSIVVKVIERKTGLGATHRLRARHVRRRASTAASCGCTGARSSSPARRRSDVDARQEGGRRRESFEDLRRAVLDVAKQGVRHAALQGPRRDERRPALRDHHGRRPRARCSRSRSTTPPRPTRSSRC